MHESYIKYDIFKYINMIKIEVEYLILEHDFANNNFCNNT